MKAQFVKKKKNLIKFKNAYGFTKNYIRSFNFLKILVVFSTLLILLLASFNPNNNYTTSIEIFLKSEMLIKIYFLFIILNTLLFIKRFPDKSIILNRYGSKKDIIVMEFICLIMVNILIFIYYILTIAIATLIKIRLTFDEIVFYGKNNINILLYGDILKQFIYTIIVSFLVYIVSKFKRGKIIQIFLIFITIMPTTLFNDKFNLSSIQYTYYMTQISFYQYEQNQVLGLITNYLLYITINFSAYRIALKKGD